MRIGFEIAPARVNPLSAVSKPVLLGGILIVLSVFIAYLPALHGGFIWDDDAYVTSNPLLTDPDGWQRIWSSAHRQSQYFPMTFTTLRLQHALWGFNPLGYHAVNVLLHSVNALLAWALLRRLAVPGAWFAAALFALHPVQVETAAWITELKNTQSTLFYLLALLAWMRFAGDQTARSCRFYALALVLHALALFSKTTACTLPAAMILVLWLRHQPVGRRELVAIAPFLLLGLVMGLLSVWWEGHLGNYIRDSGARLSGLERVLLATRAIWFYAGKLVWPMDLTFSYPRWVINPRDLTQYGWGLGCLVVAALGWRYRRALGSHHNFRIAHRDPEPASATLTPALSHPMGEGVRLVRRSGGEGGRTGEGEVMGRGPIAAIAFYVAALSPMLGFFPLYTFVYSFVADHYQYLACLGPIALFAAMTTRLAGRWQIRPWRQYALAIALLSVLGMLTWRQAGIYRDLETLWRDTLKKNPDSWLALNNLGMVLSARGQKAEAEAHFQAALRLRPDDPDIHYNLANLLVATGRSAKAIAHYQQALKAKPDDPDIHNNLGVVHYSTKQFDEAAQQFREAIRCRPGFANLHCNLGNALLARGNREEAAQEYAEALRLNPGHVEAKARLLGLATPMPPATNAAEQLQN
jgi:Flp pilus assembly protein TadD